MPGLDRPSALVLAAALAGVAHATAPTVWNFDGDLAATSGPGVLTFRGDTAAATAFGTTSSFGLPPLPGGDAAVMAFPATTPAQGFDLDHASPPNGVHEKDGYLSNYTLVYDVLWPAASSGAWRSFYNTNLSNANDGEAFASPANGIGISGSYQGTLEPETWHRVAFVVGAADGEGQMQKYVDGVFVGGQGTTGSPISSRWSLFAAPGPDLVLFGDDNGETQPGYVGSVMFVDRRLSQAEIAALGGPRAEGLAVAGAPPIVPPGTARRVEVIGHRGDSAAAPENTLAALDQAFAIGAQTCEIDVRLSADGRVVLMHDADLWRTTDATGPVAGRTTAELAALDAGGWFDDAFAGEPVPTLVEALELARGRGRLYLDTKVDGAGPGIAAALAEAGLTGADIWIWVYTSASLQSVLDHVAGARIVWGSVPASLDDASFAALEAQGVVGFDLTMGQLLAAPAGFVDAAHARGLFVSVYTILDPPTMRQAIDLGVDMMETDFPQTLFDLMVEPGDLNGDLEVAVADLLALLGDWGPCPPAPIACAADLDGDRVVGVGDLLVVLGAWGPVD